MKLKFKKLAIMALTVATVASNGMTAFAASNSKTTSGYGKLYGSLTKTGNYVTSVTKIRTRPSSQFLELSRM